MIDSQIEEIKNRLNIVEIVGSYIKLTKTGVNYRGLCPFHSEKKPSLFVSPARQIWKCFGCGEGGSVFDFVMKIEGIEFGDALKILAEKAGIELKKESPYLKTERQRLYEICELACSFFQKQLEASQVGQLAKNYLLKRGIKEESIKKWRLGYSPDTWRGLSDFLVSRGFKRDEVVKAGLAIAPEKEGIPYDRFRGRIIFPIFDLNSRVIGFGGRVFKKVDQDDTAKYINTPQTLLYDKSKVLYGLNFAKLSIRQNNQCVLTEGYTDVIMAHQAGFENTVSVSGTAMTPLHLSILKRYTENLILAFDMDAAGDTATKRGINLAEKEGFNIKVIQNYEKDKDPADIIFENPKKWQEILEQARSIMDYYFDFAFSRFDRNTAEGRKLIAKTILPAIKRLPNKIEQAFWVQKLAEGIKIKEEFVFQELKQIKIEEESEVENKFLNDKNNENESIFSLYPISLSWRKKLLEEKIISLVLKEPQNLELIKEDYEVYFSQNISSLIKELRERSENPATFADLSVKEEYKKLFDELSLREEIDYQDEDIPQEILLCLSELKEIKLRESLNEIFEAIKSEKEEQKKEELIKEFYQKARELHQIG